MRRLLPSFILILLFASGLNAQTPVNDASMYKLLLPAYSEFQNIKLMTVYKNSGTDTLKSVTINWTLNNGTVQKVAKTGLAIGRNQTWPFTAPTDLILNKEGEMLVKVWVSLPNGVNDENHANDTLAQTIQVIEKYPERHILIEEVTGAWCGYCPRAPIIYKANVVPSYPNTIFAAIHSGDGMAINDSKDFQNTYVTGVPTGFVDRRKTQMDPGIDFAPEDWLKLLNGLDTKFTPVKLNVYNYYDPSTRDWKIDVVSDFVFDMTGNYRINCYILEDSLFGTGSSWDQRNFFNGGASDPFMSLQGAGDPIPGYKHHHVVRKMLGGSWGAAGIIPATVKKGERYVYSQSFKADAKWKMENVHIVGIVQQWDTDKLKRPIINAVEGEVELITGTGKIESTPVFHIFPNPASDYLRIEFTQTGLSGNDIQVIDIAGQVVTRFQQPYQPGMRQVSIPLNAFNPGIYFVRLVSGNKVWVEKFVKQ
jgi:hypothetical protein